MQHHFDNTDPQPPQPFMLDVSDPDVAWPRFRRYMGFAGQIAELQAKMEALEASILELRTALAQARGFRVIDGSKRFEPAPSPIDGARDYPTRDEGDDC